MLTTAVAILLVALFQTPQPTDRFIDVNGLRIHYLEWGSADKPPLIMLHGIGRIAHTFDHIAPHFASRYHVMAVDMRGHGDSAWDPKGAYLVEDYVKDIEGLAQQLRLRNIVIWGNSTGGRVAQVFAGLHPDLVAAVISEDVGPERPREIADGMTARLKQEDEKGWASEEELLGQQKAGSPRTGEDILQAYVHFGSKKRPDGRVIWKRDPAIGNGFVPTELWRFVRQIKSPIIYVLGGRSTIVPAANAGGTAKNSASSSDLHDPRRRALSERGEAVGVSGNCRQIPFR